MFLKIQNLHTYYYSGKRLFSKGTINYALRDISFDVDKGDFLAIIGESGSGKSTLGNTIAGLITPAQGSVFFYNKEIISPGKNLLRQDKNLRRKIQMVFQDTYSSINPKMTIKKFLLDPLKIHFSGNHLEEQIENILSLVHLNPDILQRKPHEISGGQRQRVNIARAISLKPEILICDEITSALDVSVQAYILELLEELQNKLQLTILFISHDLSVVKSLSKSICVLYGGEMVEYGSTKEIFLNPGHPYTKALLEAVPSLQRNRKLHILEGEPPKTHTIPQACIFYDRCLKKKSICKEEKPPVTEITPGHTVKCFFPG